MPTDIPISDISSLEVLSIYGTKDNVLNFDNYKKYNYSDLLPKRFEEEVIVGGNHAYFGMYGEQDGDGVATIKPEQQIRDTADYIAKFILK